ncbi:MAG TPA: alginate export family protein [Acidobacteriaceae bacterium]
MKRIAAASSLLLAATALLAQNTSTTPAAPPAKPTPPTLTVILRERTNATEWFAATPDSEVYGHQDSLLRLGLQQRIQQWDYQLELGQNAEFGLPTDAVSAIPAQGQLGLGGTYYAANGNNQNPAAASLRQGFLRYHFNDERGALRLGRFEFFDGQETTPTDPTLAWVQNNRVAQRLVGNFGFANAQRSFDGADFKLRGDAWDLTGMAGRPTQGVFNMNANPELNVDIQYLAYSRYLVARRLLVRGFALGYHDGRTGLTKTDNRTAAARALDHRNIRIGSYGANLIGAMPAGSATFDFLLWGVLQNGEWGLLDQHAGAFAAEAGLRLTGARTRPWLRGGITRTTGDNNSTDGEHNTFFQVLPTPRQYARFPYFNMMNSTDEFVQIIDKPTAKLDLRSDLHFLGLTAGRDLWYGGGGAYDTKAFGFTGRPGNGHTSFSNLADISADYGLTPELTVGVYYAQSFGRRAVASIYPTDHNAQYGFFELDYRLSKPLRRTP